LYFWRSADRIEPGLRTGIIEVRAWCSTDSNPTKHIATNLNRQPASQQ
jgi:hypothetical protein